MNEYSAGMNNESRDFRNHSVIRPFHGTLVFDDQDRANILIHALWIAVIRSRSLSPGSGLPVFSLVRFKPCRTHLLMDN